MSCCELLIRAIAVSGSSRCWLVTRSPWEGLPQVLPAQLLRGGAQVLALGQASGKLSSWVSVSCGWEETSADEQGLIILGETSGAREAEAGDAGGDVMWCWRAALGDIVWVQKKGKSITRWKIKRGNRDIGDWLKSSAYHPLIWCAITMCDGTWVRLGLCEIFVGFFQVSLEREQLPASYLQSYFGCCSPQPCCVPNTVNRKRRVRAKKKVYQLQRQRSAGSWSEVVDRVIEF